MSAPVVRAAAEFGVEELAALFTRGYQGYYTPVQLDATAFADMTTPTDTDFAASRVACVDGAPVAVALFSRRGRRGWIGGVGVVAEARGRGLGNLLMREVLGEAVRLGLESVDLEVLEQNDHAIPIYLALGFRDRRRLDVWVREPAPLPATASFDVATLELPVAACLALHSRHHAERPPWQRDLASLEHWAPRLSARGTGGADAPSAWVLHRVAGPRLSIADAAAAAHAPPRALEAILRELLAAHPGCALTLVNLPPDDEFANVLRAVGASVRHRQREMTLELSPRPA